jgi:hypothetical protein
MTNGQTHQGAAALPQPSSGSSLRVRTVLVHTAHLLSLRAVVTAISTLPLSLSVSSFPETLASSPSKSQAISATVGPLVSVE